MSKKVKIGVLGAGRIGRLHLANLVQRFRRQKSSPLPTRS